MHPRSLILAGLLTLGALVDGGHGQGPPRHSFHTGDLPLGTVAQGQLLRDPALAGYVQPVEIRPPAGAEVAVCVGGHGDQPRPGPVTVGMLVGHVYLLKVTQIPHQPGLEVFPTIEVINRLYPPHGRAERYPVPVHLPQEELEFALQGRFVTRVVYLEDPEVALPVSQDASQQVFLEAPPGEDPLEVADRFGRPLVILRMGSRIPDLATGASVGGPHPPGVFYSRSQQSRSQLSRPAAVVTRHPTANVPRISLPGRAASSVLRPAAHRMQP